MPIRNLVGLGHNQGRGARNLQFERPLISRLHSTNQERVTIDQGTFKPNDLAGGMLGMRRYARRPAAAPTQCRGNEKVDADSPLNAFHDCLLLPDTDRSPPQYKPCSLQGAINQRFGFQVFGMKREVAIGCVRRDGEVGFARMDINSLRPH